MTRHSQVSHWIGPATNLAPLRYGVSVTENTPERYEVRTTLSGRGWAYDSAPSSGFLPRSWTLEFPLLDSDDAAVLGQLAAGAWGPGPHSFIPASAVVGNVLTPAQSFLLSESGSGTLDATGAWQPRHGVAQVVLRAPAIPGVPVTAAADLSGSSPSITIRGFDAAGRQVTTITENVNDGQTKVRRVSSTLPAHDQLREVQVVFKGVIVTRPQVTWTDSMPTRWAAGTSSDSVIIQSAETPVLGIYGSTPYHSGSITLQEV